MRAEEGQHPSTEKTSSSDLPPTISSADIQHDHDAAPTLLSPDTQENRLFSAELPSIPGYSITGELGRGGVGIVYDARHIGLNRPTAIKMLSIGSQADPKALIRFLAEAEAVVAIRHKNVVQIYDYGDHQGNPYLALELCPGGSISGLLDDGKLEPTEAAKLIAAISEGVAAAHELGIIHRDLKPANILLDAEGKPKVTDFGLAKRGVGTDLTQTKAVMGTPSYMSPEQAEGDAKFVGPQADVWALGVILYECLTGEKPFQGADTWQVLKRVMDGKFMPVRSLSPEVPRDLALVCEKCLRRAPHERYGTAAALAADLHRFLAGKPIEARPVSQWEKSWKWVKRNKSLATALAMSVLALIAGTIISTWQAVRASTAERAAQERADRERDAKMEANEAKLRADAAVIDAKKHEEEARRQVTRLHIGTGRQFQERKDPYTGLLWYARAWEGDRDPSGDENHRLRVGAMLLSAPKVIGVCFHSWEAYDVETNPENTRLLTRSGTAALLWDFSLNQLAVPPLQHSSIVRIATFAPDGATVATGSNDRTAVLWNASKGKKIWTLNHDAKVAATSFSPDGKTLLTASGNQVRFWETTTITAGADINLAAFVKNGKRLLTADRNGKVQIWDVDSRKPFGRSYDHKSIGTKCVPLAVADGSRLLVTSLENAFMWDVEKDALLWKQPASGHHISLHSNDSIAFVADHVQQSVVDAKSGSILASLSHPRYSDNAAIQPSGGLAATIYTGGTIQLWNKATWTKFDSPLQCGSHVNRIRFSADGRYLIASSSDGTARIWDVTTIGKVPTNPYLLNCGSTDRAVMSNPGSSYSPDGTVVLQRSLKGAIIAPQGFELPHPSEVTSSRFSPDGSRLATYADGFVRIWNVTDGSLLGDPLLLTKGSGKRSVRLSFNRDGSRVCAESYDTIHDRRPGGELAVWDVKTGRPLFALKSKIPSGPTVFSGPVGGIAHASFSPDGSLVAVGIDSSGELAVFEVDSGKNLHQNVAFSGYLNSLQFSPHGRTVVLASTNSVVREFDAQTGQPTGPSLRHRYSPHGGIASMAGGRIATTCVDGHLRIWDGRTGDLLIDLPVGADNENCWFGADGSTIQFSVPGGYRQIVLPVYKGDSASFPRVARLLAGRMLDETGGVAELPRDEFINHCDAYRTAWAAWTGKAGTPLSLPPAAAVNAKKSNPTPFVVKAGSVIAPDQARGALGKEVTVEFTILDVGRTKTGGWVMLNSMNDYKHADNFTAAIKNGATNEKEFGLNQDLVGRKIRVTGKVALFQKRVQIVVEDTAQLQILPP